MEFWSWFACSPRLPLLNRRLPDAMYVPFGLMYAQPYLRARSRPRTPQAVMSGMCDLSARLAGNRSGAQRRVGQHAERRLVHLQQRFHLLQIRRILTTIRNETTQDFHVVACGFGLRHDVLLIAPQSAHLFVKPLVTVHNAAKPVGRYACWYVGHCSSIRPRRARPRLSCFDRYRDADNSRHVPAVRFSLQVRATLDVAVVLLCVIPSRRTVAE